MDELALVRRFDSMKRTGRTNHSMSASRVALHTLQIGSVKCERIKSLTSSSPPPPLPAMPFNLFNQSREIDWINMGGVRDPGAAYQTVHLSLRYAPTLERTREKGHATACGVKGYANAFSVEFSTPALRQFDARLGNCFKLISSGGGVGAFSKTCRITTLLLRVQSTHLLSVKINTGSIKYLLKCMHENARVNWPSAAARRAFPVSDGRCTAVKERTQAPKLAN
ncbi:leucine-rich repeat-containing protein 31-like protein [Anopheles sinensis]|uniref:Leucine-rich repeat-containing protein 31-like protein n=1 Tax=Anopheles sinensis TaxID=74873 RepID=A0A084VIR9_ANOSI|nr:leucine-rich repeat-containing protein 31-like protein [Anopheles sinensis]